MAFWNSIVNPKRKNRFKVDVGNLDPLTAKTAVKPVFSVNAHEHNYLNHKFYFPGMPTWEPVEMTFVDLGSGDATNHSAAVLWDYITTSLGYAMPTDASALDLSLNKSGGMGIGDITVTQIDVDGATQDKWTLHNAWIERVAWGDVSYEDDGFVELSITVRYDYAGFSETS